MQRGLFDAGSVLASSLGVRGWIVTEYELAMVLEDALLAALPFVEDALGDKAFKAGTVKATVARIRAALAEADAFKPVPG